MFKKIMVPIDLTEKDKMAHSLELAGDLAKASNATLVLAMVIAAHPDEGGPDPEDLRTELAAVAQQTAAETGLRVESNPLTTEDPSTDLSEVLLADAEKQHVDLIVMACHVPGALDDIFRSHGAYIAQHAKMSVFLVR